MLCGDDCTDPGTSRLDWLDAPVEHSGPCISFNICTNVQVDTRVSVHLHSAASFLGAFWSVFCYKCVLTFYLSVCLFIYLFVPLSAIACDIFVISLDKI